MNQGLGVRAAKGVFWVGGGQFFRQGIQIITAVVLARLLLPEDFGLLGMSIIFVGFCQIFADFGVGAAIVQARNTSERALSSAFWINTVVVLVLMAILWVAAPFIADFYGDARVQPIMLALSLSLLLTGIMVVPRSILYRDLKFSELVKSQVVGSIIGAMAAVAMAWYGYGVWSLVAQPLIGTAVTAWMTVVYARWLPSMDYSWGSVRSLVHFSVPVLGADMMNYAYRQGDNLIIGKALGSQSLGYYSLAQQIMLYPLTQVSSVIVRVLFPALSRIQDDKDRVRHAYIKAVGAIAVVTFPLMTGLFILADSVVLVVFGEQWQPMTDVLIILCWVGLVQSVSTTVGTIYLSMGKPKIAFYFTLFATPVFLLAFLIGVNWGISGVAIAYLAATVVVSYANFLVGFRIIGLRLGEFHLSLMRPMLVSLIMMSLVWLIHGLLLQSMPLAANLFASVLCGIVLYIALSLAMNREQFIFLVNTGRSAMNRT